MRLGVVNEETSGKRELSCRVKPGSDSRSGFRSYLTARHAVAPAVLCTMTQIKKRIKSSTFSFYHSSYFKPIPSCIPAVTRAAPVITTAHINADTSKVCDDSNTVVVPSSSLQGS